MKPNKEHPEYEKTLTIQAPAEKLLRALTDTDALTAWWTPASGDAGQGGQIRFMFSEPLLMRVDRADLAEVHWTVERSDFMPEWLGTHPTFTIRPLGVDSTELHFRHIGLTDELDCIDVCTRGWNHFMASLRQYAETGAGMPNGGPEDLLRRELDFGRNRTSDSR